ITASYQGDSNYNISSDTESHDVCTNSPLVTNTSDSGAGSLRQAILDACNGATVTFDTAGVFATPQTITLTSGEIGLTKDVKIVGPASVSQRVTISGNNAGRVFNVNASKVVTLSNLNLTGGSSALGGAVLNSGTLTIIGSTLSGNTTSVDGGAIANDAILNI